MRGLKTFRSARVLAAGHALVQTIRRGHYEIATDGPAQLRLRETFDELALAIWLPPDDRSTMPPDRPTQQSRPGPSVHDDLLAVVDEKGRVRHEFTDSRPNQIWLTDITEHPTREGKLYLCAIKDCYSNKMSATPSTPV